MWDIKFSPNYTHNICIINSISLPWSMKKIDCFFYAICQKCVWLRKKFYEVSWCVEPIIKRRTNDELLKLLRNRFKLGQRKFQPWLNSWKFFLKKVKIWGSFSMASFNKFNNHQELIKKNTQIYHDHISNIFWEMRKGKTLFSDNHAEFKCQICHKHFLWYLYVTLLLHKIYDIRIYIDVYCFSF